MTINPGNLIDYKTLEVHLRHAVAPGMILPVHMSPKRELVRIIEEDFDEWDKDPMRPPKGETSPARVAKWIIVNPTDESQIVNFSVHRINRGGLLLIEPNQYATVFLDWTRAAWNLEYEQFFEMNPGTVDFFPGILEDIDMLAGDQQRRLRSHFLTLTK